MKCYVSKINTKTLFIEILSTSAHLLLSAELTFVKDSSAVANVILLLIYRYHKQKIIYFPDIHTSV